MAKLAVWGVSLAAAGGAAYGFVRLWSWLLSLIYHGFSNPDLGLAAAIVVGFIGISGTIGLLIFLVILILGLAAIFGEEL